MPQPSLLTILAHSLQDNSFIQLKLADYTGDDTALKQLIIKPVRIKGNLKYSCIYRYKTKDITKNISADAFRHLVQELFNKAFRFASLTTTKEIIEAQQLRNGKIKMLKKAVVKAISVDLSHDKEKQHVYTANQQAYLKALGITNSQGEVKYNSRDKYKQITHYIEIISALIKKVKKESIHIVDMGSGKGYLTFALYDFIKNTIGKSVTITGIEQREDLVQLCNDIAHTADFDGLSFETGTIDAFQPKQKVDLLIALHACDTATDDAIYKGIQHQADLIIVAPCCHKQIRKELLRTKKQNDLDIILKHGIFLERQAEMLTDSFRALLMEFSGYHTRVFDFIASIHTPKNVLIVGELTKRTAQEKKDLLNVINSRKAYFGIEQHYLEKLLFHK